MYTNIKWIVIGLIKKKQTNNIFESRDPSLREFLRELYVIGRLKYLSMPYKIGQALQMLGLFYMA